VTAISAERQTTSSKQAYSSTRGMKLAMNFNLLLLVLSEEVATNFVFFSLSIHFELKTI